MRKFYTFLFTSFILSAVNCAGQKNITDSLVKILSNEKTDTVRLNILNQIADACINYNPDSALLLSKNVLNVARQIKYHKAEKMALKILANTFIKIGNYPKAMEAHLDALKIAEKENNSRGMAVAYINIGSVYIYQEQYKEGLPYYLKADSIIKINNITDLKYYTQLNIGDVYDRLNLPDSSFKYFSGSLAIAEETKDGDFIGTSKIGLGHAYRKMNNFAAALQNYREALPLLKEANDEDMICEATLGLAQLFEEQKKMDSAGYYAAGSYYLAKKDGFQSRQLDAAEFLTDYYRQTNNIDSAFAYINSMQALKDSIESKEKVRQLQILSTNEHLRQIELEQARANAQKERKQQLQLLFIGIFIPAIFLITLLLSRIRIHIRVVKLMGILSLLILFEYLTLWLHPAVLEFTNHTPVFEILIFVCIAALLVPAHHRIEHWLINKLVHHNKSGEEQLKKMHIQKLTMKKPSDDETPEGF